MSESLLNILSENNNEIDNQKLLDYVNGRLSVDEKHEVEKWLIDNPFFSEAVEGLQEAGGEKKVQSSIDQINRQLAKYLQQKKLRKSKRKLSQNTWTYVAIVVVLMLAVLVYFVISRL